MSNNEKEPKVIKKSTRYHDVDDTDFNEVQGPTLSTKLSPWYYWHDFLILGSISLLFIFLLVKIPKDGMRIYDILNLFKTIHVSNQSWIVWLKFLSITFSYEVLAWPLIFGILICIGLMVYRFMVVKTTEYSLNFRFLEIKRGVFNEEIDQIDLFTIKDELLERPLLFRILGISRLIIISKDQINPTFVIPGIEKQKALDFLHYIRTNTYGSATEYWAARDRRRRNEKNGPVESDSEPDPTEDARFVGRHLTPDDDHEKGDES